MLSPHERALKLIKQSFISTGTFFKLLFNLFSKRDLVIIAFFTLLGIGGVFAAGLITLTPAESQGAGYSAVTSCDPAVTINKDVNFDLTLNRYVISTISISDIDQRYGAGCGNLVMELALPLNSGVTYASWTIPSSTITNGVFTFGANNSTGITYRAYTTLTPIDVEFSFDKAAIAVRPSTRAVTNGPVYDLLKDNGFTTAGQSNSSNTLTFALSLSCGTLTVDTTAPGVSTALTALAAPTGYTTNNATSTGVNGATSAAYLGFRGTLANINTVLPWISYSWKSDCTNPVPVFQAAIWDALSNDNPVAWNFPGNGHYYQLIKTVSASAPSWDQSFLEITGLSANYNTAALPTTKRSYASCAYKVFGMCGYFATVTSQSENNFIYSKSAQKGVWLGANGRCGTVICPFKGYFWVDPVAPEFGVEFSRGSSAINGNYANWVSPEPNGGSAGNTPSESALQIVGGVGNFNDLSEWQGKGTNGAIDSGNWGPYNVLGYVVEYGDSTASGESPTGGGSTSGVINWHY
jgi:hypothetical protein